MSKCKRLRISAKHVQLATNSNKFKLRHYRSLNLRNDSYAHPFSSDSGGDRGRCV